MMVGIGTIKCIYSPQRYYYLVSSNGNHRVCKKLCVWDVFSAKKTSHTHNFLQTRIIIMHIEKQVG